MSDPRNDPTTYSWLTYLWVFGLSVFGGSANFIDKMRNGDVRAVNITELAGELLISAFAGLITFYMCEWAKVDGSLSAALVGISGHMGGKAISLIENMLKTWADKRSL